MLFALSLTVIRGYAQELKHFTAALRSAGDQLLTTGPKVGQKPRRRLFSLDTSVDKKISLPAELLEILSLTVFLRQTGFGNQVHLFFTTSDQAQTKPGNLDALNSGSAKLMRSVSK